MMSGRKSISGRNSQAESVTVVLSQFMAEVAGLLLSGKGLTSIEQERLISQYSARLPSPMAWPFKTTKECEAMYPGFFTDDIIKDMEAGRRPGPTVVRFKGKIHRYLFMPDVLKYLSDITPEYAHELQRKAQKRA